MNNETMTNMNNGETMGNAPENNNQGQQQEPEKKKFKLGLPKPIKNWLEKSDDRTNGEKLKAIGVKIVTVGAVVGAFALGKKVSDMAREEQDRLLLEDSEQSNETESQDDDIFAVEEPVMDEVVDVEEYTEEV